LGIQIELEKKWKVMSLSEHHGVFRVIGERVGVVDGGGVEFLEKGLNE